jgi:hypothetical protein
MITLIALSFSASAQTAAAQKKWLKDPNRYVSGLYFFFPTVVQYWANSCSYPPTSVERARANSAITQVAAKMGYKLEPSPYGPKNRKEAGEVLIRYLLQAWHFASGYSTKLPDRALNMGLETSTLKMTLSGGLSCIKTAKSKASIITSFDKAIGIAKEMGLPRNLVISLATIKASTLAAKSESEMAKCYSQLCQWGTDVNYAFIKK